MALELQEISDRIEIDDLLVRYAKAIDTQDWNLLDTCFTPDAAVDYVSSGGIAGPYPEVRAWLEKALAIFPVTVHSISNSEIELDGDRAIGRTLVSNPMQLPGPDGGAGGPIFTVYALYHDEIVRTSDGWRLASRSEEQLMVAGDVPEGLPSAS